jgi:hypothetical protein
MKKKTRKSIFTKLTSAILSLALLVTATVGLTTIKASAASARIFSDENATVVRYEDGSGYMILNKTFDEKHPLTAVKGVPLSEIITFKHGGYISSFYYHYVGDRLDDDGCPPIYDYSVVVAGRGPKGLLNGEGHLYFTDKTNDTYSLSIWSHLYYDHTVDYNSDDHEIVKISWDSKIN